MRVIFYSALESAPSTKKTKPVEAHDSDSIDDTDKVLEALKRDQSTYTDDNLEISKSPSQLNRFGALQVDDDADDQRPSEIKINQEELPRNGEDDDDEDYEYEDDDEDEEEDNDESDGDKDQEPLVEQIREDILAYEQLQENQRKNLSLTVNRAELIHLLRCLYPHKTMVRENILTIGMVKTMVLFS